MKIKSGCIDYIGVNMAKSEGIPGDYGTRYVPRITNSPLNEGAVCISYFIISIL